MTNSHDDSGIFDASSYSNSSFSASISSPSTSSLSSTLSIFPSLFESDDPSTISTISTNMNLTERYQQALLTLRNNSQAKNLGVVYHRVLKKIKKIEHQLADVTKNIELEKEATQIVSNTLFSVSNQQNPDQVYPKDWNEMNHFTQLPKITIHPHNLNWEAIDISIPAGGKVSLPIPVPILPSSAHDTSEVCITNFINIMIIIFHFF